MLDIFDILGPVMVGPSSSHTAGAVRIGSMARTLLGDEPVEAKIHLHGSFAETGKGHGTDRALVAGLLGMRPDDLRIPESFTVAAEGVSYGYVPRQPVLTRADFRAAPGEIVALVGPSGGGKTTLCHLIPRFYEITQGSICIDGQDVRSVTQESLHHAIGVVQQDVFLFADTVRENIRYGRPDATDEEIVEAAKRAEIYDDIMAMPHGFDTYVGERGTMLSGGQKQRVSIARIFLKNPPILILDEATSALDSVTEVKIQHAFDELARGRTTLVIAHRLSTIRSADRILVVENGRIAEQGSHEALLAQNGEYASLWRTQNGKA